MTTYAPFRHGIERGRTEACERCGIRSANQHSLRESAICDALKAQKTTHTEAAGELLIEKLKGWK